MIAELPKYLYVKSYFSLPSMYIEFSFFVLLLCIIVLKSLVLIKKKFFFVSPLSLLPWKNLSLSLKLFWVIFPRYALLMCRVRFFSFFGKFPWFIVLINSLVPLFCLSSFFTCLHFHYLPLTLLFFHVLFILLVIFLPFFSKP